jgi:hypothetical protein
MSDQDPPPYGNEGNGPKDPNAAEGPTEDLTRYALRTS